MARRTRPTSFDEVIQVMVSREMKDQIKAFAEEDGKSQSAMTREMLMYAIHREKARRNQRTWRLRKMAEDALNNERDQEAEPQAVISAA